MAPRLDERAEGPVSGIVAFAAAAMLSTAAAGLFLSLGDEVLQVASRTGHDAALAARTSVEVRGVVGRIVGGGSSLNALNITVGLAPGSDPVDLTELVLDLANRTALRTLHRSDASGNGNFTVAAVRDADGSIAGKRTLNTDDLATLDADLAAAANDLLLPPREPLRIGLLPQPGAPAGLDLLVPATFAGKTIVTLR